MVDILLPEPARAIRRKLALGLERFIAFLATFRFAIFRFATFLVAFLATLRKDLDLLYIMGLVQIKRLSGRIIPIP